MRARKLSQYARIGAVQNLYILTNYKYSYIQGGAVVRGQWYTNH